VDLQKYESLEPVEGKKDLTAQVLHWARDRTEAFEGGSAVTEVKPSQEVELETGTETKPRVSPRVIVVSLHEGADDRGDAHLFADVQAAGHFVETLVEDGIDKQRLTVFNCTQLSVHLTYRAVVHLKTSEAPDEPDGAANP
jgi:hypothetical protein